MSSIHFGSKRNEKRNTITFYAPYNAEFVKAVKLLGGQYDYTDRGWTVRADVADYVREKMRKIFARDDRPCKVCTADLTFCEGVYAAQSAYTLFGRDIAFAKGRDTGAELGNDVVLLAGEVGSGGSMKNWSTEIAKGTVLRVYGVPYAAVEAVKKMQDAKETGDTDWNVIDIHVSDVQDENLDSKQEEDGNEESLQKLLAEEKRLVDALAEVKRKIRAAKRK